MCLHVKQYKVKRIDRVIKRIGGHGKKCRYTNVQEERGQELYAAWVTQQTKRGSETPYDTRAGRYFNGYRMITLKVLVKQNWQLGEYSLMLCV